MRHILLAILLALTTPVLANDADIVKVKALQSADGSWTFHVTLRHGDTGWDHYANRWEILSEDGEVLGTRVLAHPHEHEQPFTRSLSGVKLPKGTKKVVIRGHDSVHKFGGKEFLFELPKK